MNHRSMIQPLLIAWVCLIAAGTQARWIQVGLDIDGEAAYDHSGRSIALSSKGCRLAIGAPSNHGSGSQSGHVRVYDWDGDAWIQVGSDLDGEAAGDHSGCSVALSSDGDRVAIGAYNNDGNGSWSGHVRVHDWDGAAWIQVGPDIDGEAVRDESGYSLDLSSDGSRIAIGAMSNDGNGSHSGHVRVYDWDGDAWIQVGSDFDGEAAGDHSGCSVALSSDGRRLAIGAPWNDGNGHLAGHVRVYDWNGAAWIQAGPDIDGEATEDQSGASVALSSGGCRLAIGAPWNGGNGFEAGHVRVYDWNGTAWMQAGPDLDGEAAEDRFGESVALSSDGDRLAIGAWYNDGHGSYSGHVRVYDWNGAAWAQVDSDIDGEASGDQSGCSVALSSDGNRVGIGAWCNDGNGDWSGHVRVYDDLSYGVRIDMPVLAHPHQPFWVTGLLDNPGHTREEIPTFFILDVLGDFWYWPSWALSSPPDYVEIDFARMTVPVGTTLVEVVPEFLWPDTGQNALGGLYFHGAMLDLEMTTIEGEWASVEWGYGPEARDCETTAP